jgi:hypothetical protein
LAERAPEKREVTGSTPVPTTRTFLASGLLLPGLDPFVTTRQVQDELGISQPGALNLVRWLERQGRLREIGTFGRGSRTYWVAPDVLTVIADASAVPERS